MFLSLPCPNLTPPVDAVVGLYVRKGHIHFVRFLVQVLGVLDELHDECFGVAGNPHTITERTSNQGGRRI
jgi:hypothetical protein